MINQKIIQGDCLSVLKKMKSESVDCIVTSPPYHGLRDYGNKKQVGLEDSIDEYIQKMLDITKELHRVLKKSGTMWWVHGDSYNGNKKGNTETVKNKRATTLSFEKKIQKNIPQKSLTLQSARLAIKMIDEQGWILRNEIIWNKPNVMPQSVTDRFTVDFEKIFFFTKNKKYYFNQQKEPAIWKDDKRKNMGRISYDGKRKGLNGTGQENFVSIKQEKNIRTVWKIPTKPFKGLHFATFPEKLIELPIKSGCPLGGVVLDPFMGSGTTLVVAKKMMMHSIGIELNSEYIKIAKIRISK